MPSDTPTPFRQTYTVEWEEDVQAADPVPGGIYRPVVGRRTMRCRVTVEVDVPGIVKYMGRAAARNKTRKSQDGHVTVRAAEPTEVSRRPA